MTDESQKNRLISGRTRWEKWSVFSTALIGLMGIVIGALLTGYSNHGLEDRKLRSKLILKAIDTRDQEDAAKMLLFMVNLGLLTDETGKIAEYGNDFSSIPLRPTRCWDDSGWDSGWDVPKRNFGGRF